MFTTRTPARRSTWRQTLIPACLCWATASWLDPRIDQFAATGQAEAVGSSSNEMRGGRNGAISCHRSWASR
ncbi:hypothetical protein LX32DRAFT_189232 [Colletotrichum zoysiae]|uniref:Uncharacterized protein n=1 Tax=Colletotrichum zoysiae TaxID=1216348 RepID=A0AAD9M5F6_9PEZI|nr:hypothetical protein LX32DRAFT_189232 [Colletotrichum zoysiae]